MIPIILIIMLIIFLWVWYGLVNDIDDLQKQVKELKDDLRKT